MGMGSRKLESWVEFECTLHRYTKLSEMCDCCRPRHSADGKLITSISKKEEGIIVLRKRKLKKLKIFKKY